MAWTACGPSRPPAGAEPSRERTIAAAPVDAGLPPGCPAAFAAARGPCDQAAARRMCTYPEGTCWCGQEPHCGGARPSDEELARRPIAWQCAPKPPAVRADGCPGSDPDGTACRQPGKRCTYGACCVVHIECRGGTWTRTGGGCPP